MWAWQEAAELVTGGLDVLEERAKSTDERIELTAKVLEAAARTTMPAKIHGLAEVLVDGLTDDGDVNEATVLALALRDLEGSHVRVLHVMAGPAPEDLWTLNAVREQSRVQVFDAVLAVLVRHGLVTDLHDHNTWAMIEANRWRLTEVGHRCLALLGGAPPQPFTQTDD